LSGLYQMRGSSIMFEQLFAPRLAGVDFRHHAASQPEPDWVWSVPELAPAASLALARFIVDGQEPAERRLRNMALALAADARYRDLQVALRRTVAERRLSLNAPSAELTAQLHRLYDQIMPRFTGSHEDVIQGQQLLDALVRELAAP